MLSWRRKRETPPRAPKGYRAYAVGDVHGRLDLLDAARRFPVVRARVGQASVVRHAEP